MNQAAYKEVKDKWVDAKNKAVSNWNDDYKSTQQYYEHRIGDVHTISKDVQRASSDLEKEEAQLLKELELT